MKILVCGSREGVPLEVVAKELSQFPPQTILVQGGCRGVDQMAAAIAKELDFQVKTYPANWEVHGKLAGPIRNRDMYDLEKPDLTIGFCDRLENTKGTKHMIEYARSQGGQVKVVETAALDMVEWFK